MAENLQVTHYRNGDPILLITSNGDWPYATGGQYCYYDNDQANSSNHGALYNGYVVSDSRNIAPEGWHVPSDEEWKQLEMFLGMSQDEANATDWRGTNEGSKLAGNSDLWVSGDLVNNDEFGSSAFAAAPAGYRDWGTGSYALMNSVIHFWTSTEYASNLAWTRTLWYAHSEVERNYDYKLSGYSIRCIKDS